MRAREAGGRVLTENRLGEAIHKAFAPLTRASDRTGASTWGSRPRLYATARFRGLDDGFSPVADLPCCDSSVSSVVKLI